MDDPLIVIKSTGESMPHAPEFVFPVFQNGSSVAGQVFSLCGYKKLKAKLTSGLITELPDMSDRK